MKKQTIRLIRERYAFELLIPIIIIAIGESVVASAVVFSHVQFKPISFADYFHFQLPPVAQFAILNILWGAWRVYATHPVFSKSYFEWIKQTPLTPKSNLPAGPVRLSFRDTVLLGLVSGWFLWRGGWDAGCFGLIGFGAGYSLILGASFGAVRLDRVCYAAAVAANMVLWTTLLDTWCLLVAVLAISAGLNLFINVSLLQMMQIPEYPFSKKASSNSTSITSLGWPHFDLSPKSLEFDSTRFSFSSPTIVLLLAASLANIFGLLSFKIFRTENLQFLSWEATVGLHVGIAVAMGVVRWAHWSQRIQPPSGRLASKRLIFWSYDSVFAAPILGIAISAGLALASGWSEGSWVITFPLSAGLAVLCNSLIGPGQLHFRATHAGRLGFLFSPSSHELTK